MKQPAPKPEPLIKRGPECKRCGKAIRIALRSGALLPPGSVPIR